MPVEHCPVRNLSLDTLPRAGGRLSAPAEKTHLDGPLLPASPVPCVRMEGAPEHAWGMATKAHM